VIVALAACGARSGLIEDDGSGSDDDMREGSCAMPIELPFEPQTVRGRVVGGGSAEAWCGEDDGGDLGREDTYVLTPPYSTDVILTMRDGTDFPALLRVTADACVAPEGQLPETCVVPEIDDPRHFWAEGDREYYISVDSPAGADGRYELDVAFGWPPLETCDVHPMVINEQPGGFFAWQNDLSRGQGRVSGACGGPGREDMFKVSINNPTLMTVVVQAQGLRPAVGLRSSCAAASEIVCDADETGNAEAVVLERFMDPGDYYLVIDQLDVDGGEYVLEVSFS